MKKIFPLLFILLCSFVLKAQETYRASELTILGKKGDLEHVPGSVDLISEEELRDKNPISLQDALRHQPGIHVRNEDNVGLIPNIGLRGLNPDRSERILILEDGMPAGLAPYTENASYYIPPMERMDGVEFLKGSGSILWGPQTVGGVLNFISPKIPKKQRGFLRFEGGHHNYALVHGRFGKNWKPFGFDLNVTHKQGDGFTRRDEDFRLSNFSGKMEFRISERTKLWTKHTYHDQRSSQSYLGLTQALFESDPHFNPVMNDHYDVHRYDAQASLQHFFKDNLE
ncbi:MAG: TonB-dependent receptor plug domain-containing protein, partial [Deltaproteobacteria bacterium]|nr:TonB-dependent receptor plug domain-containing protein [Deltaproteobacteria bacterium]